MGPVLMVGIDGSECGNRAVDYAFVQAKKSAAKLYVVFIIEWSPFTFSTALENAERHQRREEEIQRALSDVIEPVIDRLTAEGLDVEGVVRHGHVADTLAALAKSKGVDNLILGRQGTSKLKSHVFGSVGSRLVQSAECPVTVVP